MNTPDVAGRIHLVLIAIADYYDSALVPVQRAPGSHVLTTAVAPLPISALVLDARARCRARLGGLCRLVIEGRDLHTEHLSRFDVPAMVEMLIRHIDWLGNHELGPTALQELEKSAHDLTAIAVPERRDWMPLGTCPLAIEHDDEFVEDAGGELIRVEVEPTPCAGTIRAYPASDPYCDACGVEAVVAWWERQMFGDPDLFNIIPIPALLLAIHRELGLVVKEATIRSWKHRGLITAVRKDEDGHNLYDRVEVIYALTSRRGMTG
jgi:hypothetical protein